MSDDNKKEKTEGGELALNWGEVPYESRLKVLAQSPYGAKVKVGDIIFQAGAFSEGMPLPVTPEHGGSIVFKLGDETEVLRFAPDGKIYVRGVLVQDELAVWEGLRAWLVNAKVLFPGDAKIGKPS